MGARILKYEVPVNDATHQVPGHIQHVGAKDESTLLVWSWVFEGGEQLTPVRVYGTGHPLPEWAQPIGTVQVGAFVWHLIDMSDVEEGQR